MYYLCTSCRRYICDRVYFVYLPARAGAEQFQPFSEQDHIAFFRPLICADARRNPETCGMNRGDCERRIAPPLRARDLFFLQVSAAEQVGHRFLLYIILIIFMYQEAMYISGCLVLPRGRSHKARKCRGVTHPESYITKYKTCTKIERIKTFPVVPCSLGSGWAMHMIARPIFYRVCREDWSRRVSRLRESHAVCTGVPRS